MLLPHKLDCTSQISYQSCFPANLQYFWRHSMTITICFYFF
ncbi:hypothetical protein PFLA_b0745 [Pseudoalteromonas flavipulchra NCIMB 2033 = ATCC BAA-314]|nr:hypothetical protein [Pseudoalteromonas flavipulchra NCIMB 2033 = ATCC BAA-314]